MAWYEDQRKEVDPVALLDDLILQRQFLASAIQLCPCSVHPETLICIKEQIKVLEFVRCDIPFYKQLLTSGEERIMTQGLDDLRQSTQPSCAGHDPGDKTAAGSAVRRTDSMGAAV